MAVLEGSYEHIYIGSRSNNEDYLFRLDEGVIGRIFNCSKFVDGVWTVE